VQNEKITTFYPCVYCVGPKLKTVPPYISPEREKKRERVVSLISGWRSMFLRQ